MQYKSISTLCKIYDLEGEFFKRRIKEGIFVKNQHYIHQANTIRFDLDEIEQWWRGECANNIDTDDILEKVL